MTTPKHQPAVGLNALIDSWMACVTQATTLLAEATIDHPDEPIKAQDAARARYDAHADRTDTTWTDECPPEEAMEIAASTLNTIAYGSRDDIEELLDPADGDPEIDGLRAALPTGDLAAAARLFIEAEALLTDRKSVV